MFTRIASNPRTLLLLVALIVVAGLSALQTLPRMEDPRTETRAGMVVTAFPGANAHRVEALVSRKIEDKLREIPEIEDIHSNSRSGVSVVTVMLYMTVKDSTPVMSEIRDKLNDVQNELPPTATKPQFSELDAFADTIIAALEWHGAGEPDTALLGRYSRELQSRLLAVEGTEKVEIKGAPQEEIQVVLDIGKTDELGLTAAQIASLIGRADAKVAAGELVSNKLKWQLEVQGALDSLERIRGIPLKRGFQGDVIRLGDVADVYRAPRLPEEEIALVKGERAVLVSAMIRKSVMLDRWRVATDKAIGRFNQELPQEVKARLIFDQQPYVDKRLSELMGNFAIGFGVVLVVLLITLGWRNAIIVAGSLPLTMCFTLFCLQMKGIQIHQLSVVGLVVSLGILVDNAIVMADAIAQSRRAGKTFFQAITDCVGHLWIPLLGSTLTTVLAFLPIALQPGNSGEFVGPLAWSVIFSLLGSYFIAHTVVAGVSSQFLSEASTQSSSWIQRGVAYQPLLNWFEGSLDWSLRAPVRTMILVLLLASCGFVGAGLMKKTFFPPADRDMFQINLYLPPGSSVDATAAAAQALSREVQGLAGIESIDWVVGNSFAKFYYNLLGGNDGMPYYAQAMVKASDFRTADAAILALQTEIPERYPELLIIAAKLEQGAPGDAPIEIRLSGPNIDVLRRLGQEVMRVTAAQPGVQGIRPSQEDSKPKVWVDLREDLVIQAGATLTDASAQLQAALTGTVSGSVIERTEELPVRVRVSDFNRADLSRLESGYLLVPGEQGMDKVPMSALGEVVVRPEPNNITRRNGVRVNTIKIYPMVGVLNETVLGRVLSALEQENFHLPDGYQLTIGGEAEASSENVGYLLLYINVILALLVMVVTLSFSSFRLTAVVFSVAILAAGFGLFSVFVSGFPLGFIVLVAILGLMGLAINAAIVIMAELRSSSAACNGDAMAIKHGVIICARHIVSTTLTTVGGFLPLLFDSGTFWPPFAATIIGGTLLTSIVSFYFVPAVFSVLARKRAFQCSEEPAGALLT
jgi:multidrug efflux pump